MPLTALCALQAVLSLSLVWSNTANVGEADYLSLGRLVIAHWLHGTTWPSSYGERVLSGSPVIYPPIGALANSIGGLAGARILSLVFMLGATALLYRTASRLIGPTGAAFAAALWVFTEPTIGLAFAANDPLSVFLMALSAWLIVQAGYRLHRGEFIAAAAVVLALANATAYSGIVIDPVVIAFGLLVWRTTMGKIHAGFCAAWLAAGLLLSFSLLMTFSRSWVGLSSTLLSRSASSHQSILLVLNNIWGYSGLIVALAAMGTAIAVKAAGGSPPLLGLMGCAALIVPAAQFQEQGTVPLDKHVAYGIWFATIAAGYACSHLLAWIHGARRQVAVLCCATALAYPAVNSWESSWDHYHAWPNAHSFISRLGPAVAGSPGFVYASSQQDVAEYYSSPGRDWSRWTRTLSLHPPSSEQFWESYYTQQLDNDDYGVIVLFYTTTFSSAKLPGKILVHPNAVTYQQLLNLVGDNSREPGLPALTLAIETDPQYKRFTVGSYSTSDISGTHDYGVYVIWRKGAST